MSDFAVRIGSLKHSQKSGFAAISINPHEPEQFYAAALREIRLKSILRTTLNPSRV
jgi:hypothetical protein